ncbi:pyridoxamine 5'-phosphate oxidase family protein [Paenibacillus beijingensis]|uniref:Pyridoxamine 5'-phosphate oxidase putative domain-containing protein n=1 Tax=Paenibacillus beijingensis TaxID=1126833 RepID=A0A0D5NJJ2_9BACL|nr:pyridoxamine 5'-phosphate oxidase family protein [Paenibacillus beijingensis]AJY75436.1 hypothetical protein VN24_13750 [Paenibacillus beijingensis]
MKQEQALLSEELFGLLNGTNIADKQHEAIMLQTVGADMWPHTAMISVGELLALDRSNLRLGLWAGTRTAENIIRTGKAAFALCYKGKAHYVKLSLEQLAPLPGARFPGERFAATVTETREDEAKYAAITSGVQIQLLDPGSVLERWAQTIRELKS